MSCECSLSLPLANLISHVEGMLHSAVKSASHSLAGVSALSVAHSPQADAPG